jgi:hypothetical protein
MVSKRAAACAALVLLPGLSACGAQPHAEAVAAVAEAFHQAFADGDGEAACALLAPSTTSELEQSAGTPCAEAVLEEQVPAAEEPTPPEVFGTQAIVRVGEGAMFLARFADGWKVMAAACRPRPGKPYDCAISGG